MQNGRLYSAETSHSYGTNYRIWLEMPDGDPQSVAGFVLEHERDRMLREFTGIEIHDLAALYEHLRSLPMGMGRSKTVMKIERLVNAVQKRTGIKDT